MDRMAQAQTLIYMADIVGAGTILFIVVAVLVSLPLGARIRRFDFFIAAEPKTIWDMYFFHIGRSNYHRGIEILSCDVVAENPLTLRYTTQADYRRRPSSHIVTYDVFEPHRHYHGQLQNGVVVEGAFEAVPGGTRVHTTITRPRLGWFFAWALDRRHDRDHRALKDLCEGREPKAPQPGLPARRWELWAIWAGLAALVLVPMSIADAPGAPPWLLTLPLIGVTALGLMRWGTVFVRFCALG